MLSDAIKEPHDSMVRPVRVSFFDPRTGEPCDSRPEPLRREKQRATVDELNAAIAKRERDEKEARETSEAMRRRAGLKPDKPRKPRKRPTASPRLLTCPVCGKRFETTETRRVTCSDECAKKRRAEKAQARYAAKVVRTVRECAVCGRPFEVSGKTRKLTCSGACSKVRKRELAWKAATRGAADAHTQMDSPRTATPPLVSVVK